ncbi:hypothetical protein [Krasilnikovia sp. M28-CT-15]|uniref:hypothetical protein n=1 Tax=Krasilnikovia sp. M28-CT-15 TaxID=3373540 RepID=UPI00399CC049
MANLLPYVVAPPGPARLDPLLRGVVRVDERRARIAVSTEADMASGIAVELDLNELSAGGSPRLADTAVLAMVHAATISDGAEQIDSHNNTVAPVSATELDALPPLVGAHQELFRLLVLLTRGSDCPWFSNVYTLTGFMFQPARKCRIYVQAARTQTRYGLQVPLLKASGQAIYGVGAGLVQELFARIREGQLHDEERLAIDDDYCDEVFDLTEWIDPPLPLTLPPAPPDTEFP